MQKKFWISVFIVSFLLSPFISLAQSNSGFIPSDIWFSKENFEEGEKIQIYSFVFNTDDKELSGNVAFYDKTTLLGKKSFSLKSREVTEVFIDWIATAGDHNIFAKIENAKFLVSTGKYETAVLEEVQTDSITKSVKKKIVIQKEEETGDSENNFMDESLEGIGDVVDKYTPDIISKPLIGAGNIVEKSRINLEEVVSAKKEETKEKIQALKEAEEKPSAVQKPWQYVLLFFYTLLSFISSIPALYYIVLFVISFYLLRYIYRLFF